MKAVTQYQADDGAIFDSEEAAQERDLMIREVDAVMAKLPPRPEAALSSGKSYLQHAPGDVLAAQAGLARIARRYYTSKHIDWVIEADRPAGGTFIGRLLCDSDRLQPINRGWWRIECIDEKFREWEQPYFTRNPPNGAVRFDHQP